MNNHFLPWAIALILILIFNAIWFIPFNPKKNEKTKESGTWVDVTPVNTSVPASPPPNTPPKPLPVIKVGIQPLNFTNPNYPILELKTYVPKHGLVYVKKDDIRSFVRGRSEDETYIIQLNLVSGASLELLADESVIDIILDAMSKNSNKYKDIPTPMPE